VRALTGPTPGTERSSSSFACQTALSRTHRPVELTLDLGQGLLQPAEVGVDPPVHERLGRLAPVALGGEHLEQLPSPHHQGPEVPGGLVRQGPHRRPHRLGEAGDHRRVEAVGLCQPARGAGEGAHPARVDHRHRQAGRGQGRREADLHPAGGLEHDERRCRFEGGQAPDQRRHALLVVVEGEALAGGARVEVEAVLGNVDADEWGNGSGDLVHDPVSLMRARLGGPGDRSGWADAAGGAPCSWSALLDPWDSGLPPAYPIPVPDRVTPTYEQDSWSRWLSSRGRCSRSWSCQASSSLTACSSPICLRTFSMLITDRRCPGQPPLGR
jgi:hypothetical protein